MAQGIEDRAPLTEEQLKDLVTSVVSDSIAHERASIGEISAYAVNTFIRFCKETEQDPLDMSNADMVIFLTGLAIELIPEQINEKRVM